MKKIKIRFLFFDDKVCNRCKTTEDSLFRAVENFKNQHKDFEIEITKQKLTKEEIKKSPTILLDEIDLETYIFPHFEQQSNYCSDCSCLVGQPISCRMYGDNQNLSQNQILSSLKRHIINKRRGNGDVSKKIYGDWRRGKHWFSGSDRHSPFGLVRYLPSGSPFFKRAGSYRFLVYLVQPFSPEGKGLSEFQFIEIPIRQRYKSSL